MASIPIRVCFCETKELPLWWPEVPRKGETLLLHRLYTDDPEIDELLSGEWEVTKIEHVGVSQDSMYVRVHVAKPDS